MSEIAHTLDIAEGWYGSQNDEAAFFEWLGKISCVSGYRGCHENGADLVRVDLTTSAPNDANEAMLPMEFAVEAQKLLGISLEGSVG